MLKWLHEKTQGGTKNPQSPSDTPTGAEGNPESAAPLESAKEIDLTARPILAEAVGCARHALIMEFRARNRFDPTMEDLADWIKPIWPNQEKVRDMIRTHNSMALGLGERFEDFWEVLERRVLRK